MVCSREHLDQAHSLRRLLATYSAAEDLIRIGAYQKGADALLDQAVGIMPELKTFLEQTPTEAAPLTDTAARLLSLAS
jgi:flagellum-specific ATP synthase